MKKILCLFPRFGIGGIPKALCFVANVCHEAGYEVICTAMSMEEESISLHGEIPKYYVEYRQQGSVWNRLKGKLQFFWRLRNHFKEIQPDLILVFGADNTRIALMASAGMGCKIIGSERGNPERYTPKQKKKYAKAFQRLDAVVFQTEMAKGMYAPEVQRRGVIIPNPAAPRHKDVTVFSGERDHTIVTCSRLSKEKNLQGVIRAFAKMVEQHPEYQLRIYGDGPQQKELEQLSVSLGIEKRVFFFGNQADVFELERACGMYVLNSLEEGMPNALIEAMLAGIPSIATDCPSGGVQFLSDGGRRVRLVPVHDDDNLTTAMLELAEDKVLSEQLVERSKELTTILKPETIGKKWLDLIETIWKSK